MPGNHGLAGCLGSTSVQQNRGAQVSSKPIRQIDEQTDSAGGGRRRGQHVEGGLRWLIFPGRGKIKARKPALS